MNIFEIRMENILVRLKQWKEDIECDLRADWPTELQKREMAEQRLLIGMAISHLQMVGSNNNIKE